MLQLWLDGVELGRVDRQPTTPIGRIGGDGGGAYSQAFGTIADFRLFPCALTPTDIHTLAK